MRPADRATARRQLDKRLAILSDAGVLARPPRGWIKAIREALGMTTAQLAKRMGVSQPRIVTLEQSEEKGTITLETLERAARALDCRLVYALAPRKSLDSLVEERALLVANNRMENASHTMALEAQAVGMSDEAEQIRRIARQIIEKAGGELWSEK